MLDFLRCDVGFIFLDGSLSGFWNHAGEMAAGLLGVYILVDKVWAWRKDANKQHESEVKEKIAERTQLSDRTATGWHGEWEVCQAALARAKESVTQLEATLKERDVKLVLRDDEIERLERKVRMAAEQHDSLVGKMDLVIKQIHDIALSQNKEGDKPK